MDARGARILVVFSILFFVALVGQFVVRLGYARESAVAEAEAFLDGISQDLITPQEGLTRSLLETNPQLRAVAVFSFDSGLGYLYARQPDYVASMPADSENLPRLRYDEITEIILSRTLRSAEENVSVAQAVFTVLDQDTVYPLMRESLIYILGFTVLVIIIGLLSSIPSQNASDARHVADANAKPNEATHVNRTAEPLEATEPGESAERVEPEATEQPVVPGKRGERVEPGEAVASVRRSEPVEPVQPTATTGCPDAGELQPPISPETGIGCDAHMQRRLKMELDRSAHSELDFSIAVVRILGTERYEPLYLSSAEFLRDFFGFPDLCFEFGPDQVVVLLPNTDLQEALALAQRFRDGFRRAPFNAESEFPAEIVVGLSSRNGRLLEPDRIVREATTALKRAVDDPGRIIGFQADSQKYREFLADQV